MMIRLSSFLLFLFILSGCRHPASPISKIDDKTFKAYWNQGKAEISSYALDQTLEGHHYTGTSVMTFTPEDFSRSKQFKIDEPKKHPNDDVKVMKLNLNEQFVTGINPYHLMTSVFLPLDYDKDPHSLKWVASVQDWNGQWFVQGNWKGHRYEVNAYSYFESEGDTRSTIVNTFLEDEIWTKIRVSPNTL
ncbi:MAG TPA: hypothetical protein VJ508_01175, partial [Saprospiraceae bacterium]|nr:hypothetical protein [Saprospiraceae bacterium]